MPQRRYRCTWDQIAWLDSDHMAGWGAFQPGRRDTIDFDSDELPKLAFEMNDCGDEFSVAYQWRENFRSAEGEFIRTRIALDRRPCRFGGTRAYFICPCCRRHILRLAVLPEGLRCGQCGRVTWGSRREQPTHRLIRRANRTACKLGLDDWRECPTKRPPHMHQATFERLVVERQELVSAINQRLAVRLSRSGLTGALANLLSGPK